MTSKNLYFRLMKEDLKSRLWAAALIGLVFFFQFPVVAAMSAGRLKESSDYGKAVLRYGENMQTLVSFSFGFTVFLVMVIALICGMSSFSYLNSKKKVDFYHALPVKRETLYVANFLNGILIMAVPYAVMLGIGVVIAISNGANASMMWSTALSGYGLSMVYYFLLYSMVIIAVMLAGNLVISFLGVVVFCSFMPMATTITLAYFSEFFHTFSYWMYEGIAETGIRLSPFAEYIWQVGKYSQAMEGYLSGYKLFPSVIISLLVSAVLAVLGGILYKKRPSEAAGKAMAFAISKPIIRIAITMLSAMGMGLFFWSMQSHTGWAIFGILWGAVIAHCVIEIIYHFDFKKLFANYLQLAGCVVVAFLLLIIFRYDCFGYDRYIPAESKVKEAAVNTAVLNDWTSYGQAVENNDGSISWESSGSQRYVFAHMKGLSISDARALAEIGVEWMSDDQVEADYQNYTGVDIQYTLKSGRKVYRSYNIPVEPNQEILETMYKRPEYKNGTYPVLSATPEQVVQVVYREMGKDKHLRQLTEADKAELLQVYQEDFRELTMATMQQEMPVGLIRFADAIETEVYRTLSEDDAGYYNYYSVESRNYYPVYSSFHNTIAILGKHGIIPGDVAEQLEVSGIRIVNYSKTDDNYNPMDLFIYEPEEIERMKSVLAPANMQHYNSLIPMENNLEVEMTYKDADGYDQSIMMIFFKNQIPEYVKLRLTNEDD